MPKEQVTIVDCGELKGDDKLTAENANFLKSFTDDADSQEDSPSDEEMADVPEEKKADE